MDNTGRELGRLPRVTRSSPTLGLAPPLQATVLFGGGSTENLEKSKVSPEGLLMPEVLTKMPVQAFHMHLEFRTPFMPTARDQPRGNSGVYIQRRYEVQILDSFGLDGVFNECGALYRQTPPDINMCLPPLTWQTYDIWFTPPQFAADGQTKIANARITVLHNGVPVHWHREITAKTGGGQPKDRRRCRSNFRTTATLSPSATSGSSSAKATSSPLLLRAMAIARSVSSEAGFGDAAAGDI